MSEFFSASMYRRPLEDLGEARQAQALFAANTAKDERQQRQYNQNDQAKRRPAHDDMLEPEPPAWTGDPNRAERLNRHFPCLTTTPLRSRI